MRIMSYGIIPNVQRRVVAQGARVAFASSGEVLDRNHPDVLQAVTVLTKGSPYPAMAFRQRDAFTLKTTKGELLAGKAGSYLLIHKVPEDVTIDSTLAAKLLREGLSSKDYWANVVDETILHQSYSFEAESSVTLDKTSPLPGFDQAVVLYKAAGLKQKVLIPKAMQTTLISLEGTQTLKPHQLVLLDVGGNPYPKNANQFLEQFKPDPSDPRSQALFDEVRQRFPAP